MTMRALSALPLDDDIVDRIMTFCPTFGSLQATILVSKAFHRVFQTHPKSITRAVAYNIVGPALPQAIRVLRYPYNGQYDGNPGPPDDPVEMATACPEEHEPSVITADEKWRLQENSKVVEKLENIYSLTTKDRTSETSVLTSEESWRFRRAAYRIMLYCNLFPGDRYSLDEIEDLDDDVIDKIRRQRTAVLNQYPTDELLELFSVVKFLTGIFCDIVADEDDDQLRLTNILLSTGPAGGVTAWEYRSYDVLEDDINFSLFEDDDENKLFSKYFTLPFENIWTTRKVKPPKEDELASKWVLDSVNGANDTCTHCATPGGLKLLTEATWGRQTLNPVQLLKSKLRHNPTVMHAFSQAVGTLSDVAVLRQFITGLFDDGVRRAPAFDGWQRTDSYCPPCLLKFVEEHAWVWFFEEQLKTGWAPPEDCWYGYNCNTQTHRIPHAQQKNHLCVPTRGNT
ncbi:hypothetical protein DFH09DRAFT_1041602 [Mycena vulgaris]|nr:hypothetical protein DFH09DRAFT_1041602 [Mycena vulgaris]